METREHRIEYARVRDTLLGVFDGYWVPKIENARQITSKWLESSSKQFYGATKSEMTAWLTEGFYSGEIEAGFATVGRRSRKLAYGEDGELQVDMALSGHDFPYLDWTTRNRKPGIAVEVGFSFASRVSYQIIAAYGAWVARLLSSLETQGYSLALDFVNEATNTYLDNRLDRCLIRVKEENEESDYAYWSALFSPGGYRMLGFLSKIIVGQDAGLRLNRSLGAPTRTPWGVDFDADARVLKIRNLGSALDFPADDMDKMLAAAMGGGAIG